MDNTSSSESGFAPHIPPQVRALYLETLAYATGELLNSPAWKTKIDGLFERLSGLSGAERICLFEIRQRPAENPSAYPAHLWERPGGSSCPDLSAGEVPSACFALPRWQTEMGHRRPVAGALQEFPEEERAVLQAQGIQSVLAAPVFFDERWWGYVQMDFCTSAPPWPAEKVQGLQGIINILGAAIQRQQTERAIQALYTSERFQRMLATRLRKVGESFNATLSFDTILDRILDQAPRLVVCDAALLLLVIGDHAVVARQRGRAEVSNPPLTWEINAQPGLRQMFEAHHPLTSSDPEAAAMRLKLPGTMFPSWLAAPVMVENQVLAFLLLENREAGYYTNDHADLLALFTAQAALALRNAQLFADALDTLEREQHLNQITRAISSAQDLPTILKSVVRLAVELVGADCGTLGVVSPDGSSLQYPSVYNLPPIFELDIEKEDESLAWQIIQSGQPLLLDNYAVHPRARPEWASIPLHAMIAVPVATGNRTLGVLGLFSCQPGKQFTRREMGLVEMVARQAAVAIENVRLFDSAHRRAHEADKLRQAVSAVTSALDLDRVLESILVNLAEVVPYDSSAIFLFEGDHLRIRAGRGFPNLPDLKELVYPLENPLLLEMNAARTPIIIHDAQTDPRFQRWGENSYIHGWMGLPLMARGELIGYMTIDHHLPGAYGPAEAALVQAFANEAAIAIENARLFQQVQHLAITDPLTNIYNRRHFFEAAHRELERARRYDLPLAIILLDLDHFKGVNDTYGHLAGDAVLIETARRCQQNLREVDILARYGGEEFVILLPLTSLEGARQLAERLREAINQPVTYGQLQIIISASLGVTELTADCPNMQALIEQADQALYHTKHKGRGQVSLWPLDKNS